MNDTNDPFLVTSQLGILSVVRSLIAQKTLVHMRLDRNSEAIITTVLDVDTEQERIIVDAAADDAFNRRLGQANLIHFDALVDKIRVQFSTGPAQQLSFDQRNAFSVPYPEALRRLQRRDHFRIDIPVSMPLFCEIPVKGGSPLMLPVKDISAGGVALQDPKNLVADSAGAQLKQCVFELDDVGTVTVNLRIQRISEQTSGDAKPTRIIACQFDSPTAQHNIMVQNYIGRLERLLNARRRGFD